VFSQPIRKEAIKDENTEVTKKEGIVKPLISAPGKLYAIIENPDTAEPTI